ncbi:MAG TPA: hypothetical protein VMU84_18015, partial [Thermoanaerobaculia bacterium]|nr:hypothetical protein [Thermoanaerobaculia bacterium]
MLKPEEVVRYLRVLRERIPSEPSSTVTGLRRRLAHVDANFVHAAVNAVGATEGVQKVLGRTDEELREEIDVSSRWTAVADELRSLLQSILLSNSVRRQRIGLAALQTYKICQQMVRDEKNASLEAHIVEMKRLNRFGRRRRTTAPAT